jgi:hypothetical protein
VAELNGKLNMDKKHIEELRNLLTMEKRSRSDTHRLLGLGKGLLIEHGFDWTGWTGETVSEQVIAALRESIFTDLVATEGVSEALPFSPDNLPPNIKAMWEQVNENLGYIIHEKEKLIDRLREIEVEENICKRIIREIEA